MLLPHGFILSISILQSFFLVLGVLKYKVPASLYPTLFGFFRKGLLGFFPESSFNLSLLSHLDANLYCRNLHKS